jgi:PAS domain S-box-containing protein
MSKRPRDQAGELRDPPDAREAESALPTPTYDELVARLQIFESITDGLITLDSEWRYTFINAQAEEMLGRPRSVLLGKRVWDEFPSSAGSEIEAMLRRVVADRAAREFEGFDAARGRWYENRAAPTPDGGVAVYFRDVTDRKRAEEASRQGERRFRAVFEGALDAMVIADDEGRYVDANPAACSLFGLPREQLLDKSVRDFIEPGFDLESAWSDYRRAGAGQGLLRLIRPDGVAIEVEYAAKADVLPGRHLSSLRDVTERVRVEEALRESERKVITILESITDAFYTLDRGWRFSYMNPQAEPILGRSRSELLGRVVWDEFPEAIGTAFDLEFRRAVADRVPVAFEIDFPPLGGWFSIHAYPSPDGLSVYFTDVTERHQAEEALRESERRFRLVLEGSRDVIYQLDLTTRKYDYISPAVREVLGLDPREIAIGGLPLIISLGHPEDLARLAARVSVLMSPGPDSKLDPLIEYRVRVPGKGWRWMSDSSTVIRDEDDTPTSLVGNVRDVTDEKGTSERLRDLSRRLIRAQEEERRYIAGELHDEIGQALTAIKLDLGAALRSPGSAIATRRLKEGLELVSRTIGQVRDLSLALRPSMLDDLGLVDALRSYASKFTERSGVDARFSAEGEIGRLDPDVETACFRIAQEALTNVARHSGAARVRVELSISTGGLRLIVADDGTGFDVAAAIARASGGSSLGVLSMRERAILLGGCFELESAPGRGTEVRATFPPVEARPELDSPGGAG